MPRSSGAARRVRQIALAPLELADTTALIADTLHHSPEIVQPLAALVQTKTQGNPFFVSEFLKSLYVSGLLSYAYPSVGEARDGGWRWDVARIQERGITDNVVELLDGKVQTLPLATQRILRLAACIGNQFDLAMLALASEQAPGQAATDLWPAVVEGLVLPLGDAYKLTGSLLDGVQMADLGVRLR